MRPFFSTHKLSATETTESANSLIAVDIGKNATFAGDIDIGNPLASIGNIGALDLGGEVHALQEQDRPEFPVPDIQNFRTYATGPVIDVDTDISGSNITLVNAVIAAGTNPKFPGNANIDGILYIEIPNNVTFVGNINLRGIIVAEGDVNDPGGNQITLGDPTTPQVPSNFVSGPYPPGEEFDAMRCKTCSCVLGPGFAVSFWKNISTLHILAYHQLPNLFLLDRGLGLELEGIQRLDHWEAGVLDSPLGGPLLPVR